MGSRTTFSRKRGIQRGETGLPGGMVGLQNQASGFGVNRDPGEAGEEAIAKQASFAGEDRVLMEARGHVGEFLLADFHSRFCLWNRDFRQSDGNVGLAFLWPDARGYPLQGGCATGVQPDPLALVAVHGYGNAHPTRPQFERQDFARAWKRL